MHVVGTARKLALAALLAACAALAGCGPGRYLRAGDAMMLASRPADAARSYLKALDVAPHLARDPDFVAKLNRAQCLAHYQLAHQMADEGRWDEAIRAFNDSIQADPSFQKATQDLQWAKAQAAKAHHKKALELADQGKLNQAILELNKALELDPQNLDARDALDSIEQKKKINKSRSQNLYEKALALEKDKRLGQMAQTLEVALGANRNHIPARVARWRARTALAQARDHAARGKSLLAEKRLDRAQRQLREALRIWPFYDDAKALLAQAVDQRQKAEQTYRQAVELANDERWDDAVATAARALDLFPYHDGANALLREAKEEAAAAHCRRGRDLLERRQLEAAESAFLRALGYLPAMGEARDGLARADALRGLEAQRDGLWGNAMLWYLQAAEHADKAEYRQRLEAARAQVFDRARFALRLEVQDAVGGTWSAADALRSGITTQLSRASPELLSILPQGARASPPTYGARVELVGLEVDTGLVASDQRAHDYTVAREVPNPRLPRLHHLLLAAQRELAAARREFHRPCPACHGSGRRPCPVCHARGWRPCQYCDASGKQPCRTCKGKRRVGGKPCPACRGSGTRECEACGGDGRRTCTTCRGRTWVECKRCHGTGRGGSVTRHDLQRAERQVVGLRHRLSREPETVVAECPAQWPYVVHTYRKSGAAEARLFLTQPGTGTIVRRERATRSVVHEDRTIENPNPEIGLGPDPLELPSDLAVRQWLLDAVAPEAASKLLDAVYAARTAHLRARAETLSRQGDDPQAVETLVDLARTLEDVDREQARALVARLKDAMRPHP
ncbi:MAG: hypothetical protein ACLF0G_10995 [Candidatus Brocadiia bacterium]